MKIPIWTIGLIFVIGFALAATDMVIRGVGTELTRTTVAARHTAELQGPREAQASQGAGEAVEQRASESLSATPEVAHR